MGTQNRHAEALARMFRVLGDPTRLRILVLLGKGELNVTGLCDNLRMCQPTVSHHLSVLRMSGLVDTRRNGKEIFYSLCDTRRSGPARELQALLKSGGAVRIGDVVMGMVQT